VGSVDPGIRARNNDRMNMSEGPNVQITCVGSIFSKQMHFLRVGDAEQGHAHTFDHITLLSSGRIRLTALGTTSEFSAPHQIYIKAGVEHELTALEDNTIVYCIHPLRERDLAEVIVDPASLPAYQTMETFKPDEYFPLVNPIDTLNALEQELAAAKAELAALKGAV
jgi:hypothetical protein